MRSLWVSEAFGCLCYHLLHTDKPRPLSVNQTQPLGAAHGDDLIWHHSKHTHTVQTSPTTAPAWLLQVFIWLFTADSKWNTSLLSHLLFSFYCFLSIKPKEKGSEPADIEEINSDNEPLSFVIDKLWILLVLLLLYSYIKRITLVRNSWFDIICVTWAQASVSFCSDTHFWKWQTDVFV